MPSENPSTSSTSTGISTSALRKPWYAFTTPLIGKGIRKAARLAHSGGSAFPGKIAETIDPSFLARTLAQLPLGVVLVSGTNGKTTTTRMVATMLEGLGLRVFTNPTGSNFTRGVVSALLDKVTLSGKLDADIAVLELDEAYAVHFVKQVQPRYCLLLNVMRDQLDRFGEIDNTARLLSHVAEATTGTVVLNREDPRIAALTTVANSAREVRYFGLDSSLQSYFPSDDDMTTTVSVAGLVNNIQNTDSNSESNTDRSNSADKSVGSATGDSPRSTTTTGRKSQSVDTDGRSTVEADVLLMAVGDHEATFHMDGANLTTAVKLEGVYNLYNAAAALAVVRAVLADPAASTMVNKAMVRSTAENTALHTVHFSQSRVAAAVLSSSASLGNGAHSVTTPDVAGNESEAQLQRMSQSLPVSNQQLMQVLSTVTPAFGRGEAIDVNGSQVELLLVKNPMGFRLSLASFQPQGHDTMICINDEYADGRDMSWLWDVDFTSLRPTGVAQVSGVRAWDMALRLEYDQVPVANVSTDLDTAVEQFVTANPGTPKHIYCTYTAMLAVRAKLGHITNVADAGVGR